MSATTHLLQLRAKTSSMGQTDWEFVDETMRDHELRVISGTDIVVSDGDIWTADLISTEKAKRGSKTKSAIATLRLVTRVLERQPWQNITELPDFWTEPAKLKAILTWLHTGQSVALIGPKGTGKSSIVYAIAKALGWQHPCKVDVYMAKKTSDLFGSDAAEDGSTLFRKSALLDFIERAWIAWNANTGDIFPCILDELNRVHAKSNESLHGLFDDIGQITFTTTQGPRVVKRPPNMPVIATMNIGYTGTFELDEAMRDRFMPMRINRMPIDVEVEMVRQATGVLPKQALDIVTLADQLRRLSDRGECSFAPSFRGTRATGHLVRAGFSVREAIMHSMTGWLSGDWMTDKHGTIKPTDPTSEVAKVLTALTQNEVTDTRG